MVSNGEGDNEEGREPDLPSSNPTNMIVDSRTMAQFTADAKLMAEFDRPGGFFNYAMSAPHPPVEPPSDEEMTAYLSRIQRGGLVQPFGCTIAIGERDFLILGYSENCFDMLGVRRPVGASLVGVDARTLFTRASAVSLTNAVGSNDLSFLNPIWVHSRTNERAFYAILHTIDVGVVIDLEPAHSGDPTIVHAGAVQSQKLAVRAISRIQELPGGDMGVLCDTVVQDVQKLTGYDRVMVYRFHEDNHGEVLAEIRPPGLEPYLGLHYPAIDIPQAARFLFMKNRVRMIYNCNAVPVRIIQSQELMQPLCLINSTLRAPHGCHTQYMANMGSVASLVLAVVVNCGNVMKLWGLVVCHHTSPRYVAFPLRYACEFLMQAFALQLHMEIQLASQMAEKRVLRMQTLLCDMLLRDAPLGIVTQSPNIINLVKCDGAALYYDSKCWCHGVTPTEEQLKHVVDWLISKHGDCTGLSTESLVDAGYPGAAELGDPVCGMAMAKIGSSDFLFWFRSHTEKEIKWGGAMHHPEDIDDGDKMHPRTSFKAFLEVVKSRSLPWEPAEIDAIHSLQLLMRDSLKKIEESSSKRARYFHTDELTTMAVEMVRLIETATAPFFGVDPSGSINGWNAKMCELTGLEPSDAIGKSLVKDIVHNDSREAVENLLTRALQGNEDKNVEVKFRGRAPNSYLYFLANACISRDYDNKIVGVCFVGQDITAEKTVMDKFIRLHGDYKSIMQSVNPLIPPIFASDENARCCEWNGIMESLTGWSRYDIIGKLLPGEVFGSLCQLKGRDVLTRFKILLYRAISGHDTETLPFGFYNRKGELFNVYLTANKRLDERGTVMGCLCFLQMVFHNENESRVGERLGIERFSEIKELAYIRQELRNPLHGIRFTHQLLERSNLTNDQKQFLETCGACEKQIFSIIDDADFGLLEEGKMDLKVEEFVLGKVVTAVVSQTMILISEKNLRLIHEIPEQIKAFCVYGDQFKLQLALSDFLMCTVEYAPSAGGWVEVEASAGSKLVRDGDEFVPVRFRMAHPGEGLPDELIEDMYGAKANWTRQEGTALNISQKLLTMMNGNVHYIRGASKCYFQVDIEFKLVRKSS